MLFCCHVLFCFSGIGKTKTSFCGLVADSVLKNRVLNAYLLRRIFREVSKMHDSDAYLVRECLKSHSQSLVSKGTLIPVYLDN